MPAPFVWPEGSAQAPVLAGTWVIIFRQTVESGAGWLRSDDKWSVNPDDPLSNQYSVLDTLESYRGADGKFTLQLRPLFQRRKHPSGASQCHTLQV